MMTTQPKKRGRKRKTKKYFTDITEMAICAYNNLDPDTQRAKRNRIYTRFIYHPIDKLAEILVNTGRYDYIQLSFEDKKHAVVAHINEKLHMYQAGKGKAFSYFNRVGKNHLIQENQKAYEKVKVTTDIDSWDNERNIVTELYAQEALEEKTEFLDIFIDYIDETLGNHFNNRRDIAIADSLIYIIRHRMLIENYNKKALYILIRERCRLRDKDQQYVTKVVNTIKDLYYGMLSDFQESGRVVVTPTNNFF